MRALHQKRLVAPIKEVIDRGVPFFGVCLGLQLLLDSSEEGPSPCLGVTAGRVLLLPPQVKRPHMGWNQAVIRQRAPLLEGIDEGSYFYYVHSYYVLPTDPGVVAVECDYHQRFCAMIWQDNVFATQFHPEKSQQVGLRMLKNFADLSG